MGKVYVVRVGGLKNDEVAPIRYMVVEAGFFDDIPWMLSAACPGGCIHVTQAILDRLQVAPASQRMEWLLWHVGWALHGFATPAIRIAARDCVNLNCGFGVKK